jgi:hypothetical protein
MNIEVGLKGPWLAWECLASAQHIAAQLAGQAVQHTKQSSEKHRLILLFRIQATTVQLIMNEWVNRGHAEPKTQQARSSLIQIVRR